MKTDTQAERLDHEAEARERQAEEAASKAKAKASAAKDKAKAKAAKGAGKIRENADNPVVVGNAITVGLLGTALGVGAYRKYTAGELTWKVVGAWAGGCGFVCCGRLLHQPVSYRFVRLSKNVLGVPCVCRADSVVRYLFKKYPPKN